MPQTPDNADAGRPKDYSTLIEQSMEELRIKTTGHDGIWHLSEASWFVDQDKGTIVFTSPKGLTATASVQVIGTYNSEDGTWLWGWDNPSVDAALQTDAKKVKAFGERFGIPSLITRKLKCTQEKGWEFTALACKLCKRQGGYRGPDGTVFAFMTFGEVTVRKRDAKPATPQEELHRLLRSGEVAEVFLFPPAWGGAESSDNITWLPPGAIGEKEKFEARVAAEIEKGVSVDYQTNLEYDDDETMIPARLKLTATGDGVNLRRTVNVNGYRTW